MPASALLLASILSLPATADFKEAFTTPAEAAKVNEHAVGVVFERDERFFDLVTELGSELELAAGLRLVPIVGKNHVQSVYDLLYLDGVDLALVRSDSVEYIRRVAGLETVQRLAHNVVRLAREKIVILARDNYQYIDELAGQPVAFGRPGSGEFVTGTLLFDTLGVEVEPVEAHGKRALDKLQSGSVAAMIYLLDAPGALPAIADAEGLSVIALAQDDNLSDIYRFTTLDAEDLPGVITEGEPMSTYSVDVNLVTYAWNLPSERAQRMERFVAALVEELESLPGDTYQPAWKGISLSDDTPNLQNSPMVSRAIAEREATRARLIAEKKQAEEAARAEAERVKQLVARREQVISALDDELSEKNTAKMEKLLDQLDVLIEESRADVLAADPQIDDPAGTTAVSDGNNPTGSDQSENGQDGG